MRTKLVGRALSGLLLALTLAFPARGATAPAPALVGTSAPLFSLASSQDRLVNYETDYYGRHHLVLTFFPAAFTPV